MAGHVRHFAINADDPARARAFYERVFGWSFRPWGPPGFLQIDNGQEGLRGALQQRRDLGDRGRTTGLELTFDVDDLAGVASEVVAAGGKVLMERSTIAHVGHLQFFEDPEGNLFGAMEYDSDAQ